MKPTIRILIIDDEPLGNEKDSIVNGLKDKYSVVCHQIDVFDDAFLDEEAHLINDALMEAIIAELVEHDYDLILVDFDYGKDVAINGLNIIDCIRNKSRNKPIILYTANQEQVIRFVVGKDLAMIYLLTLR